MGLRHSLIILTSLFLLAAQAKAEFLAPIGEGDKYGCAFKSVYKIERNAAPEARHKKLNRRKLQQLINSLNDRAPEEAKILEDIDLCKRGKLRVSDPCDMIEGSSPNRGDVHTMIIDGRLCFLPDDTFLLKILIDNEQGTSTCTGTALTTHIVTTAAHCFVGEEQEYTADTVTVVAGDGSHYTPDYVEFDPRYKRGSTDYDMAVLLFEDPLPITPAPPVLRVDKIKKRQLISKPALMAGFGFDELQFLGSPIATWDTISNYKKSDDKKSTPSISMKYKGYAGEGSICQGDSGGPLFYKHRGQWRTIGVTAAYVPERANKKACTDPHTTTFVSYADNSLNTTLSQFACLPEFLDGSECPFSITPGEEEEDDEEIFRKNF